MIDFEERNETEKSWIDPYYENWYSFSPQRETIIDLTAMGGSKSKEVVQHVEKSARNVISKQKPVDFSGSIAGNIFIN